MLDEGRARIGLGFELLRTPPGAHRFAAVSDHHVTVHAGAPVRMACHGGKVRALRMRGDIDVFPAGTADEWYEDDAGETVDLRLPPALVHLAAEEMGLDPDRTGLEPRFHIRDVQIEHIAWALDAERRAGLDSGRIYRESLGLALAAHLLSRYPAPARPRGGLAPRQLSRVTEYVDAHLADDVSLLRLAEVAGVSASHFRALFKRTTGVPVHAWVVQRRVERARALLVRGDLPASEVALAAGFAHQSHMARWMRRVLGVTPTLVARSRA